MSSKLPKLFPNEPDPVRSYLESIARAHPRAIALHDDPGNLWSPDENGRHWGNVTEHCLVEAARVYELAELLGFGDGLKRELVEAAVVHDFYKKREIELTREHALRGGSGREGVLVNEGEARGVLLSAGFSEAQVLWVQSVSGDPDNVIFVKGIVDSGRTDPEELARIILHYVDNYTRGASWVTRAEESEAGVLNDIDRRNIMNAENPDYQKMNEEGRASYAGHPFFDGMTRFEAARSVNHEIEKLFSLVLAARGVPIRFPEQLPEFIDELIRERVRSRLN